MTVASMATPSIGSVAQTRLAGDAARTLQWLRVLGQEDGPAAVAATLDALGTLRTDLRSLRPILDKGWTVARRDGLNVVTEILSVLRRLDDQVGLLVGCGADDDARARPLLDSLLAQRAELVAPVGSALDPEMNAALALLACGREPAPLRAAAPVGDPGLPAAVLFPPMLHRRWRKLVNETPLQDLGLAGAIILAQVAVHRTAAPTTSAGTASRTGSTSAIRGSWPAENGRLSKATVWSRRWATTARADRPATSWGTSTSSPRGNRAASRGVGGGTSRGRVSSGSAARSAARPSRHLAARRQVTTSTAAGRR
jgi:hypothetical protein